MTPKSVFSKSFSAPVRRSSTVYTCGEELKGFEDYMKKLGLTDKQELTLGDFERMSYIHFIGEQIEEGRNPTIYIVVMGTDEVKETLREMLDAAWEFTEMSVDELEDNIKMK
eukprot:Awhi_evm1s12446